MRTAIIIGWALTALVVSWGGFWVAGAWVGGYRERHQRFLEEQELLAPVLANDPAFAEVRVFEATGPGGGVYLMGTVKAGTAFDRLKAELSRLFGEPRAKALLSGGGFSVQIETPPPTPKTR